MKVITITPDLVLTLALWPLASGSKFWNQLANSSKLRFPAKSSFTSLEHTSYSFQVCVASFKSLKSTESCSNQF